MVTSWTPALQKIRAGRPVEDASGSLDISGKREYRGSGGKSLPSYLSSEPDREWNACENYVVTRQKDNSRKGKRVCIVAPHATCGGGCDRYTASLAYNVLQRLESTDKAHSYKLLISATPRSELDYNRSLNSFRKAVKYYESRKKVLDMKGEKSKELLEEYDRYWTTCAIPAASVAEYAVKKKAYKGFQNEIDESDLVIEIHGFGKLKEKDYSNVELGTKSGKRSEKLEAASKRYCERNSGLMDASVNHIFSGGKTSNKQVSLPRVLEKKPVLLVESSYNARTKRSDDLASFIAGLSRELAQELL